MISSIEECVEPIKKRYGTSIKQLSLANNVLQSIESIDKISLELEKINLSDNQIEDISPLEHLSCLVDINLSNNRISDISSLARLSQLQILDLRGNNIKSISDLSVLSHLTYLKTLFLENNPCSSSISSFPKQVFSMLPYLETLDSWHRSAFVLSINESENKIAEDTETRLKGSDVQETMSLDESSIMKEAVIPSIPITKTNRGYESETEALRIQIQAMETAFALQEKTLSNNGLQAAVTNVSYFNPSETYSSHSDSSFRAIKSFPYMKLLTQWRKTAIENIYSRMAVDHELKQQVNRMKAIRDESKHTQYQNEAIILGLKERLNASVQNNELLHRQVETIHSDLKQERKNRLTLETQVMNYKKSIQQIWSTISGLKAMVDDSIFQQQVMNNKSIQQMKLLEDKLFAATKRLQFATVLFAQKEISLRNSMAAIEVERKLLFSTLSEKKKNNETFDSTIDQDTISPSSSSSDLIKLSDLRIQPEVEALLMGLFRHLDPGELGEVHADLLLRSLQPNPSHKLASTSASASEYECSENQIALGELMKQELGMELYDRLISGLNDRILQSGPEITLTWGEFLILLLPPKEDMQRTKTFGLTATEWRELYHSEYLNQQAWAMIPLQINNQNLSHIHSHNTVISGNKANKKSLRTESDHLSPYSNIGSNDEMIRLADERSYLLKQIQEMNRTMVRQAEGIKGYFIDKLTKSELRESRAHQQLSEQNEILVRLKERLEITEKQKHEHDEKHMTKIRLLEQDVLDLKQKLDVRIHADMEKYEQSLIEEKAKNARLDTEYQLLQREFSKKEVKCKGLQRDIIRIQATLLNITEERDRHKKYYEELVLAHQKLQTHHQIAQDSLQSLSVPATTSARSEEIGTQTITDDKEDRDDRENKESMQLEITSLHRRIEDLEDQLRYRETSAENIENRSNANRTDSNDRIQEAVENARSKIIGSGTIPVNQSMTSPIHSFSGISQRPNPRPYSADYRDRLYLNPTVNPSAAALPTMSYHANRMDGNTSNPVSGPSFDVIQGHLQKLLRLAEQIVVQDSNSS